MNHFLQNTFAVGISAIAIFGAAHAQAENSARFSSFSYSGHDEYYDKTALPDESFYFNPILPGWYSDPSICSNGKGDYYLVTSTFVYYPGIPIFHSRDLVNWKQVGNILTKESQIKNFPGQHVSGGIFAPAIAYNPANETYYMVTTNVGWGNFFVKTKNPAGEWSDPIFLPEVQGIDPAFFFDTDGKGYIVNNDDAFGKAEYPGHRTVRVVEFDPATDKCVGERRIVVDKGVRPAEKPIWCEGPHIYKINGDYYLMTAEGGTSDWHSEVIYRAKSPFGPYTAWDGNPMLTQRTLPRDRQNPVTCAGHADLVQDPSGEWWGVFLGCRPAYDNVENLGRETFMLPVRWTSDGWPYMTCPDEQVPMLVSKHNAVRGDNPTFGNFSVVEEFDSPQLGMEWMTLRAPATDLYSLTETPGSLTLKCAPVASTEKQVPAFVCRRVQHHNFDARTSMNFTPAEANEKAGLLLFKDETHQYFLGEGKDGKSNIVYVERVGENDSERIATAKLPGSARNLDLRITGDGRNFCFYYSTNGGKKWQQLAANVDASYTSTAKTGGFTGTTIGMYASSK